MALVYPAFDTTGEHDKVAVKLLPSGRAVNDRWADKAFDREQRSLERLRHPNIVSLLDGGRDPASGERYLVFPWLERDLRDHLTTEGAVPWERWWRELGEPILDGLAAAFRQNVIHRDLKPDNVLLTDEGEPQVIDFGIAKLTGQLAPELTLAGHGSPPFSPPGSDDHALPATRDVYAWAALTCFAVSGVDPYDPAGASDRYAWLDMARDSMAVPEEVTALISRCLADRLQDRPANAAVLLADVRAAEAAVAQRRLEQADGDAPVVYLRLTRTPRENLELDRDLNSDGVDALLARNFEDEMAILSYGGEGKDGQYLLVGTELSLHLIVDNARDHLVVLNAMTLPDSRLERDRERGWKGPVRYALGKPTDREAAGDAIDYLEREVTAHHVERKRERQRQQRARPLMLWRGLLSALRAVETDQEDPIRYSDHRRTSAGITFTLDRAAPREIVGQERIVSTDTRPFRGRIVQVQKDEITVKPRDPVIPDIPLSGDLRLDISPSLAAIKRQQEALDSVEYGRALRTDLVELLTAPADARTPVAIEGIQWSRDVDEPKRRAVGAALGSQDVLLVQGPPGTGKTTFIAELVIQELRRQPGARVLLSSQTNAAVDNALEVIAESDPSIRQLRIARPDDERVALAVREQLLDRQLAGWRKDIVRGGRAWLREWAKANQISERNVEVAMRLRELAEALETRTLLEEEIETRESELADLRRAARGASPSATAPETLADVESDIDDLRQEASTARGNARDEAERLVELGALERRARPEEADPASLRQQAADLVPSVDSTTARCQDLIQVLAEWHSRFGRGSEFSAAAIARAQVVAATCVGLGSVRGYDSLEFDLCIIDEASKATAPELLIPMARARRFVLVGDEHQLPPYIEDEVLGHETLQARGLSKDEVKTPLFAQLAEGLPTECVVALTHQHRMHPAIGGLVSKCFYDGALSSEPREHLSMLSMIAPSPVTWLTTSRHRDRFESRQGQSTFNELEARCIKTFLNTANGLAHAARRKLHVAVLTGYSNQRSLIEQRLVGDLLEWENLDVECQTVDAYQGRQADVVLYSVTRSNRDGRIGFLRERPRINVALSRARDCLVIVGDHVFARNAKGAGLGLRPVVEYIEEHPETCAIAEARLS
jgi:serine/threonine protein kinase